MRAYFLSCAFLVVACTADTFTGPDSGGSDAAADVAADAPSTSEGGTVEAGPTPIDPSSLGSDVVLWLRAEDAATDSGTHLVSQWPDHSPHQQPTKLQSGGNQSCNTPGITMHADEINGLPAASFCNTIVEAPDDSSLQFGLSDTFVIAAVIQPGAPAVPDDCVLATKSTSPIGATGFALVAPNKATQFDAYLRVTDSHVTGSISAAGEYHILTMVRRKGASATNLTLRVDGAIATSSQVTNEDVSEATAPFAVGGFDTGQELVHIIPGKLAEIVVVAASSVGDAVPAGLDLYLKQKYGL